MSKRHAKKYGVGQHPNSRKNLVPGPPPPAPKGNKRAAKHDVYGGDLGAAAAELVPEVFEVNPQLDRRRNAQAVARLAILYARIGRAYEYLVEQPDPVFARRGQVHPIYERLERWERQASAEEDRLAISPLTRARLGLDTLRAADLATAMSEPDPEKRRVLLDDVGLGDDDE